MSRCGVWSAMNERLRSWREEASRSARPKRLAVCLTGQLRLFMVSFPALVENVLASASRAGTLIDFFYVGPDDMSYAAGRPWLTRLPGLRGSLLYSPALDFSLPAGTPLARLRHSTPDRRPIAEFNVNNLYVRKRYWRCPAMQTRSRLVQALQASQCLPLIEEAERADGVQYDSVMRTRVDLLPTRPIRLPGFGAGHEGWSPLNECPSSGEHQLGHHDFVVYGTRRLMGLVLGALDGVNSSVFERSSCSAWHRAASRIAAELPASRCKSPQRGGTPVATVRGSVNRSCFFVDIEYPPVEQEEGAKTAQPTLCELAQLSVPPVPPGRRHELRARTSASLSVASACLGLVEAADPRWRNLPAPCLPRGGWDGDFRTNASPWDHHGKTNRRRGLPIDRSIEVGAEARRQPIHPWRRCCVRSGNREHRNRSLPAGLSAGDPVVLPGCHRAWAADAPAQAKSATVAAPMVEYRDGQSQGGAGGLDRRMQVPLREAVETACCDQRLPSPPWPPAPPPSPPPPPRLRLRRRGGRRARSLPSGAAAAGASGGGATR